MVNSEKNIFREIKKSSAYSEDMLYQCWAICAIFDFYPVYVRNLTCNYFSVYKCKND